MKKLITIIFLWFLILLALFLPGLIQDSSFVIGGSSSIYPLFQELNSLTKSSKVKYYYNSLGSRAGLLRTQGGTFVVGFMSKEAPSNLPSNMKSFVLAVEGIIFIYHLPASCKSKTSYANLKIEELEKVFLQKEADWSLLSGFTCTKKEKVFRINREEGSGTRSVFEKKLQLKQKAKNKLYFFEHLSKHSGDAIKVVKQTPGSIAYMSYFYKKNVDLINDSKVGVFKINNVFPNKANFSRDYVFLRPLTGLFLKKNKMKIMKFLKFLASEPVKKMCDKLGLVYEFDLKSLGISN